MEREEYKHVCKLCNKRFPSGKSLGGHMRSHVIANSKAATALKLKSKKGPIFDAKLVNGENDLAGAGYELRENPKKSWRVEDERVCKKCGKGFQSLKALCGHMSCHSNKERNFSRLNGYDHDEDDDDSWDSNEDEDDDEEEEEDEEEMVSYIQHQRSKKVESFSFGNGSSSNVSEIEHEQEEVAICLMMLSRDSGQKGNVNFSTESSDNNSVILGDWSSSTLKVKKQNLDSTNTALIAEKGKRSAEMNNSDSGYFENGVKELESVDSVDGYARKLKSGSGYVELGSEIRLKRPFRIKSNDLDEYETYPHKKMKQESLGPYKSGKYECSICQRTFKTHQALGGHIITHRRSNNGGQKGDDHHLSVETSNNFGSRFEISKPKVHKCPFCPKVFKSGQALGGHKRSHLIGCSSEDRAFLVQSAERNSPSNRRVFLDLNLPAPSDEEAAANGGHF